MRVITEKIGISNDKEELLREADYKVLGVNAIQQSAKIAKTSSMN